MATRAGGPEPGDVGISGGAGVEVISALRHQLEMVVDRLRDARRMAAMLGRTTAGYEPDPRVEILGNALEATVEDLSSLCSDHLAT